MRVTLHLSAIDNMSKVVNSGAAKSLASIQRLQRNSARVASQARTKMVDAGAMAAGGAFALAYPLKMAANYERLRLAMNIFTGDAKKGSEAYRRTIELAANTPLGLQEIARASTMMMGYGQSAKDALSSVKTLGDITALTPAGDLNAAIVAYGQAAQEGKALTRDLRQFINAGVPIVDILKNTFGNDAKIMELASQGKITFKVLKDSLEAATSQGGKFNNGLKQLSETAEGSWTVLVDEIGRMAAVFGESVLPELKALMAAIKPVVAQFAGWAKENQWFTKTVMYSVAALTAFAGIGMVVAGVVWITSTAIGGYATVAGLLTTAKMFLNAQMVAYNINAFTAIIRTGMLFSSLSSFAYGIVAVVAPAVWGMVTATWGWITSLGSLSVAIYNIPVVGWILAAVAALIAIGVAVYKNWDAIVDFFSRVAQAFKEFIPKVIEFGRGIGNAIKDGVLSAIPAVMSVINGVVSTVGTISKALGFGNASLNSTSTRKTITEAISTRSGSNFSDALTSDSGGVSGARGLNPISTRGGDTSVTYSPNVTIEGSADESMIAGMLDEHKDEIYRMVEEKQRLKERRRF